MAAGDGDGAGMILGWQLGQDVRNVVLDGGLGEVQLLGAGAMRHSLRQQHPHWQHAPQGTHQWPRLAQASSDDPAHRGGASASRSQAAHGDAVTGLALPLHRNFL